MPRNQRGTKHVLSTLIQWHRTKIKIVAVSFLGNGNAPAEIFFEFDPTSTGNDSPLKSATPKKYHNFEINFHMDPPGWGIVFENFE